jgi:autotransporter-associated beta strand protein
LFFSFACGVWSAGSLWADTFVVNNAGDAGAGSLRQAVLDANVHAGSDMILIDEALAGGTINLASSLPELSEKVSIDGPAGGALTIRYVSRGDIFTGGFPLSKESSGKLIFAGNNNYSGGTAINGGVLQGSSWSLKGDIVNNGQVVFDQDSADGIYTGNITGSGSLTKIGPWKLKLTGTSTYTGGTYIDFGLLEGDTSNLQGPIVNNSALIFDQNVKGTYNGDITGTGQFAKIGGATLVLNGRNTYQGLTIVSGGVLQGNTNSLPTDIINGSAVIFDQPFDGTYAGKINYQGSVTKEGAGTLTLSGVNTYTGRTVVNQGALRGNTRSLQGDIINNAAVIFDQPLDGFYSGSMSGPGSLTKTGPGTLTLTGFNSYTGPTTITDGRLIVAGQIAGPVNIQGGTLEPTGVNPWVTRSLNFGGTPASPAGTLEIGAGAIVIDYPTDGSNPTAQIRQQIIAGRGAAGGDATWTGRGITSMAAANDPMVIAVGYANNAELPKGAYTEFMGRSVDATSILLRGTRMGDATLDGVVGDDDMGIVNAMYGLASGADWSMGDFDYDGDVDDNDVTFVSALYDPGAPVFGLQASAGTGAIAAVPEPASWLLAALGAALAAAVGIARKGTRNRE